jgi:hypothetical protein
VALIPQCPSIARGGYGRRSFVRSGMTMSVLMGVVIFFTRASMHRSESTRQYTLLRAGIKKRQHFTLLIKGFFPYSK